jgi:predicted phage tail protein
VLAVAARPDAQSGRPPHAAHERAGAFFLAGAFFAAAAFFAGAFFAGAFFAALAIFSPSLLKGARISLSTKKHEHIQRHC